MGNVLSNISKDNTRFTIFESNQVLTADQLNDLFNYLDVQSRLTRTRAIGVGIICGLEIGQLENKNIVVSKGAAITTDGDLLHVDKDLEFDVYSPFEDVNAKYPFLVLSGEQKVPIFALGHSKAKIPDSREIGGLEQATNSSIKDYAGLLYLEDYTNDPDVCTGTDCDNKGAEAIREMRVLLIHKNSLGVLLKSIPNLNKNYFSLEDISVPRAIIKTTIDKYAELNAAYNDVFTVKEEIKTKIAKAYQVCRTMLEDQFDGADPTSSWNDLLDQHFKTGTTIYTQYVYDFARDISYAYNELKETLFSEGMMCCPDVQLFPKHILLGLVQTASISSPLAIRPTDIPLLPVDRPVLSTGLANTFVVKPLLRFNIGSLIKRFSPIHIDMEYRHHFYESPILNGNEDSEQQIKFCFMRINAMIRNFKVPTVEELQNVNQSLKITPGYFEEKPLGDRCIPFYYRYNKEMPMHLYWNFKANVRKKEEDILSYNANQYANKPAVVTPLRFNILPFDFFRVEGHIGFGYKAVEAQLNRMILDNNLPFNVQTVQVERNPLTIPLKPWYFPELHVYEHFVKNSFVDQVKQVDFLHTSLKEQTKDIPKTENANLTSAMEKFTMAKDSVLTYAPITQLSYVTSPDGQPAPVEQKKFDMVSFKNDVQNVIKAATDVKVQTKVFDFSNTAIPHDFIINTDIISKADLIIDLVKQKETKKKEELMLGNFMKLNPGLEHTAGVLRGGTFVIVYTSNDEKVVADFMLPYYVPDKDIVPDPPVIKPLPLPIPKLELPKVFEKIPPYKVEITKNLLPFQEQYNKVVSNNEKFIDTIITVGTRTPGITNPNVTNPAIDGRIMIGEKDLTDPVTKFQRNYKELENLAVDAPDRDVKEAALLDAAAALTKELNEAGITSNAEYSGYVKGLLYDVNQSTGLVQKNELKARVPEINKATVAIGRQFNKLR